MIQDRKSIAVRAAAILTDAYVAGDVIDTKGVSFNQLAIYWKFTKGSLTTSELKVEFSNDNSTFYQESVTSAAAISGGASVVTVGVGAYQVDTTGNYRLTIPLNGDKYIKISTKGTGTVTSSSATIQAELSRV